MSSEKKIVENTTSDDLSLTETIQEYSDSLLLRMLIQAIPYLGGSLDTFLAYEGEKLKRKRFDEFIAGVTEALKNLEAKKIDEEFIQSEEFYEHFNNTAQRVVNSSSEVKRQLFRNIFLNGISPTHSKSPLKNSFLDILEVLSSEHIKAIRFAKKHKERSQSEKGITPGNLHTAIPSISQEKGAFLLSDMERLGLIERAGVGTLGAGPGWRQLGSFGEEFVQFILTEDA